MFKLPRQKILKYSSLFPDGSMEMLIIGGNIFSIDWDCF